MYVVSTVPDDFGPVTAPEQFGDGVPFVFKGCAGFFHPAAGATGVVLCSPWGYEDLTMRKSWRILAGAIAEADYPCIRFDYPGTGNSVGTAADVGSVDIWLDSINAAAEFLRMATSVRRFVFAGQSLGATLAIEAARVRSDVVGLELIAPVVRGRAYVRELAATANLAADRIGIRAEEDPSQGLSVLGFAMSKGLVESLKTLDLTKIESLHVDHAAIYDQLDRKACAEAVVHLKKLGADVTVEAVQPFRLMVSDATQIQPLPVAAEKVIQSLKTRYPIPASGFEIKTPYFPSALVDESFREEPVRFGPNGSLFGILCRPLPPRGDAPAVILLNRGLNPHIGWRRGSVEQARGLAGAGITSLRFDVAGLGESRDALGRPASLIYSDLLIPDIRAAVDLLATRGHTRIMLAGVCSGAYMALQAAAIDPRVTDIVAANVQRFVWNPAETLEDVIRFGLRSFNDYVGDMKSGHAIRKLLKSRRRIVPAMRFLIRRNLRNALAHVPLRVRSLARRGSLAGRVDALFRTLAAHGTRVSLLFSDNDPGLIELQHFFGPGARAMRFANVSIATIPDADHNLTSPRASAWMLDHMIGLCDERTAQEDVQVALRRVPAPQRAVCQT